MSAHAWQQCLCRSGEWGCNSVPGSLLGVLWEAGCKAAAGQWGV